MSASVRKVSLVVSVLLAALGIALLAGPWGKSFVRPGELSKHHAVMSQQCSKCHVYDEQEVKELHAGLAASQVELLESKKCGACHNWGDAALNPHALPAEDLERLTREAEAHLGEGAANPMMGPPMDAMGQVACATCHREHQGRDFSLTALGNNQCQSCHTAVFESLADGHPELGNFGYDRRTRLVFQHTEHEFKHFKEGSMEFRCAECHSPDADQEHMVLQSYEAMCASCHDADLVGEGRTEVGVAFLRLPGVDVMSLERAGIEVGGWPADADEGFDAMPSVFLDALISADPEYSEFADDQELLSGLDLSDLYDATDEEAEAAGRYVRAARRLMKELAEHGQGALLLRLERIYDPAKVGWSLFGASDRVSEAALIAAWDEWFGGKASTTMPDKWGSSGGWLIDSEDFTLRYLPEGHADGFLRAWHDLAAEGDDKHLLNFFVKGDERCTACHSVDLKEGGGLRVNWHGEVQSLAREFTRFSHKPHLKVVDKGCTECHRYNEDAAYIPAFKRSFDPAQFDSEFLPLEREDCASCHSAAKAGDECIKCHRYHVGEFEPVMPAQQ